MIPLTVTPLVGLQLLKKKKKSEEKLQFLLLLPQFYHSPTLQIPPASATISSTTQTMLETGEVALWNRPRQLNDVNTRSQHFCVLDLFLTSTSRHQYCLQLPVKAWQQNGHTGKVWFCFLLFLICLLPQAKKKRKKQPIQRTRGENDTQQ